MAEMIPFFRIKTSEIMSRKRKEQPLLEGIEITGVAAEGNAIARVDEMVVLWGARRCGRYKNRP